MIIVIVGLYGLGTPGVLWRVCVRNYGNLRQDHLMEQAVKFIIDAIMNMASSN